MAEEKEGGFKITDRRMFNPDGSLRDDAPAIEVATPVGGEPPLSGEVPPPVAVPPAGPVDAPPSPSFESAPPPEWVDEAPDAAWEGGEMGQDSGLAPEQTLFNEFLMQIASSAFIYLGLVEHPATGRRQVDLRAARETIDMLDMLREKTRGNLLPGEEKLFSDLMSDLKMQFLARSGR